jgi:predicted transcriptional regulator YheO
LTPGRGLSGRKGDAGAAGSSRIASSPASTALQARGCVGKGGLAARKTLSVPAEMVPDLARALGQDHEVALHDLRLVPHSIIAIGGNLTSRSIGGPTTDILPRRARRRRSTDVLSYPMRSVQSRILRSSTLFIRDPQGTPLGCLCINTDITDWLRARTLVDGVTDVAPLDAASPTAATSGGNLMVQESRDGLRPLQNRMKGEPQETESCAPAVDELAVSLVSQAIEHEGVAVQLMQEPYTLQILRELESPGLFLRRDAVGLTAFMRSVSRYSVCRTTSRNFRPTRQTSTRHRPGEAAPRQRERNSRSIGVHDGGETCNGN